MTKMLSIKLSKHLSALSLILVSFYPTWGSAFKVGDVSMKDFAPLDKSIDTSYGAVILAHYGYVSFEQNTLYQLRHEKKRIRITGENGYEAAEIILPTPIYKNAVAEYTEISGYVHNLENGQIVSHKLSKDDIYKDKVNDNLALKK